MARSTRTKKSTTPQHAMLCFSFDPELRLDCDNLMDWIPPLFRDAMFSSPVTESSTVRFALHPRLSPIYPATAVPLISPGHPRHREGGRPVISSQHLISKASECGG